MASLNPYAKVHEADQEKPLAVAAAEKSRRRKFVALAFSATILIICIVVAAAAVRVSRAKEERSGNESRSISSAVKAICNMTLYPDSCYSSLSPLIKSGDVGFQPQDIFRLSVQVAANELTNASREFNGNGGLKNLGISDNNTLAAIEGCQEMLILALDHLNTSLSTGNGLTLLDAFDDLRTWLSSAGTYQQTCIDGFENSSLSSNVIETLKNSTEFTSNSLAIVTWIESSVSSAVGNRRLMSLDHEMPGWMSGKDRMLLQGNNYSINLADAVVAQDGSGKYTSINEALADAPNNSKKRYVIYIKKGVYVENVKVDTAKWNVVMIGDGMNATLVSGSLNFVDGTPTFSTATFGELNIISIIWYSIV